MPLPKDFESSPFSSKDSVDTANSIDSWFTSNSSVNTANYIDQLFRTNAFIPEHLKVPPIENLKPEDLANSFSQALESLLQRSYLQNAILKNASTSKTTSSESKNLPSQIPDSLYKSSRDNYYRTLRNISINLNALDYLEDKKIVPNTGLVWIDPIHSIKRPESVEMAYLQETSGVGNELDYYPQGFMITSIELIKRLALLQLFGYSLDHNFQLTNSPCLKKDYQQHDPTLAITKKAYQSPKNPNIYVVSKLGYQSTDQGVSSLQLANEELVVMRFKTLQTWIENSGLRK